MRGLIPWILLWLICATVWSVIGTNIVEQASTSGSPLELLGSFLLFFLVYLCIGAGVTHIMLKSCAM